MKYWWVNQGKTYQQEVGGGFVWSPKVDANGAFNYSYQTLTLVSPGDVIFSYAKNFLRAVGVVQKSAYLAPKPDFGIEGDYWGQIGWNVEVEFYELEEPFSPKSHFGEIKPLLPPKYSPLTLEGTGNQKVYLVDVQSELASLLLKKIGLDLDQILFTLKPNQHNPSDYETELEIAAKGIEGDLEKIQLVMARRGQGVFKHNVRLHERSCRISQVDRVQHLRASHIKPWSLSNDVEKIDGNNGLLLAPHVDHLFDQGFISFTDLGRLLVSEWLDPIILDKWKIDPFRNVGAFSVKQARYLDFHQSEIFLR